MLGPHVDDKKKQAGDVSSDAVATRANNCISHYAIVCTYMFKTHKMA